MSVRFVLALVVLGFLVILLLGVTAVWVTGDIRFMGTGVVPVGLIASAIAAYYELKRKRTIRAQGKDRIGPDGNGDTDRRLAA